MQAAFVHCDHIPAYLAEALERIRNQFSDLSLFTTGGCGILASALATLCQKYGQVCELSLIHRYDPRTNTDTLSHITLGIPDTRLSLDVTGAEADLRWVENLMDREIEIFGQNLYEFTYEDIAILPKSPSPVRHLQRITQDYEIRTPIMPFYGNVLSTVIGSN